MNGRMIAITVAALTTAMGAAARPAAAPPPSAEALAQVRPPAPAAAPRSSPAELTCLALNVYFESKGQPIQGQLAVAHVTLNRVGAPGFRDSICKVVTQGCQFGWTCSNRPRHPADRAAWAEARQVAARALTGEPDPTGGALYFHGVNERPAFAAGRYANRRQIGDHIFFRLK